jgi:uncharacterized protein with GYD domain
MAKNKNASGGGGGIAKIRALKSKNAPNCRGVVFYKRKCIPISAFLSREIFNFFYFFLNSFLFRSIVAEFPGSFSLRGSSGLAGDLAIQKEDPMPHFLLQGSYTQEAWARLVANPQDRTDAVRAPIEKLGGRVHTSFFAFGPSDIVSILEMPDNVSAAAIAIAFAAGGSVKNVQTTPLMTTAEALDAVKKAGTCGYRSITAAASAAAARP